MADRVTQIGNLKIIEDGTTVDIEVSGALRLRLYGSKDFTGVGAVFHTPQGSHPTLSVGESVTYVKGNYFIHAYNDGGTTKYRYFDQTNTAVTWVYATVAP